MGLWEDGLSAACRAHVTHSRVAHAADRISKSMESSNKVSTDLG